jgi:tetratricopeptide (TPR) repeat protein
MATPKDPPSGKPSGEHGGDVVPIAVAAERRRHRQSLKNLRDLKDATEALADDADAHRHFTMLGNLCFIEGANEEAIAGYSRALSLAPDDLHARTGRGRARSRIGELDLALADFDRALELAPDNAKLHFHRGYCLSRLIDARRERGVDDSESEDERKTRCEDALASLERAVELGFADWAVYYELLCVREEMGDAEASSAMLDRAIAAVPDEIPFLAVRYDHRRRRGDVAGAEADRLRMLELGVDPTRSDAT